MTFQCHDIRLDERLETVAGFVRPGSVAADIGTDHGYLICELALRGVIPRGYACDINALPLERARKTVARCGLGDRIELRLCDGLSGLTPGCARDIVVAGMGGELICDIIAAADWLRDGDIRLILQPMTKADELRAYLCRSGFDILAERAALAGKHVYTVISAVYSGVPNEPDELFLLAGRLPENAGKREKLYIAHQAQRCRTAAASLAAGGYSDEAGLRLLLAQRLESLAE